MATRITTVRAALMGGLLAILAISYSTRAADDSAKKPADPPPAKTDAPKPATGSGLDRFQAAVNSLSLTDDQKPKIDKLFETAHADMKALADKSDASDRDQKLRAISAKLRADIGQVLTNEQKADLVKKMAQQQQADSGAIIDKIKKELDKPGMQLTEAQRKQVDALLDDTRKKLDTLRAEAHETHVDPRPKMNEVIQDMRKKLAAILAPDRDAGKK
jgi:Spy/CpxP family protein refolding chaperone